MTDRCTAPPPRRTSRRWLLLPAAALVAIALVASQAQATHETSGLSTEGCAVTPGGWGAPPNGHNPGALLEERFDEVFGDTLVVGDLEFDDAEEVRVFLRATGGGFAGAFERHTVALAINIAFGDAGLLDGTVSDVEVPDGDYEGLTAAQLLEEAEDVLVNDSTITGREYSALNDALAGFNEETFGCHRPPDCPEDLVAIPQADGSVLLTWGEVDAAVEYGVYRGVGEGEMVFLDSTTDTEYLDTTTAVGQTYSYTVTAFDGVLESKGCAKVTTTAIPFFPSALLGAVAVVGSVGAFAWMRRK